MLLSFNAFEYVGKYMILFSFIKVKNMLALNGKIVNCGLIGGDKNERFE